MRTKNIIIVALLVLLAGFASCKKDHDIPIGTVFNEESGGGDTPGGGGSTDSLIVSVSANPSEGGTVTGSGTYQQGQSCTVTATANNGYNFINWTENDVQVSTNASYTFTVTGNRTLVANFTHCDYSNIILNEINGDTKFIEIYNKGASDMPLTGMYIMKDDYLAGTIWTADANIVAPAHSYVVLYSTDVQADHPELGENLFFNSGLSSKKTFRITLFTPDGTERDVFSRGTTGEWGQSISNVAPQSYARTPNGGDWKLADPTPGEANPTTGEDIPDVEVPFIFSETFATGQGSFTIQNVSLPSELTYVWMHTPNYSCMKATAYVAGQTYETESWLISPIISLSGASTATLKFEQVVNYASPQGALAMMISTNYNGNVTTATWTELNLDQWPNGTDWNFITSTADLTQYVGQNVTIAFKYTSTTSASATWEVKNFLVEE